MGISSDRFVTEVSKEFHCYICLPQNSESDDGNVYIFEDPVEVSCGHIFCSGCINPLMDPLQASKCPVCNESLEGSPKKLPRIVMNIWRNFDVKCKWHKYGCEMIMKLELEADHSENCFFKPIAAGGVDQGASGQDGKYVNCPSGCGYTGPLTTDDDDHSCVEYLKGIILKRDQRYEKCTQDVKGKDAACHDRNGRISILQQELNMTRNDLKMTRDDLKMTQDKLNFRVEEVRIMHKGLQEQAAKYKARISLMEGQLKQKDDSLKSKEEVIKNMDEKIQQSLNNDFIPSYLKEQSALIDQKYKDSYHNEMERLKQKARSAEGVQRSCLLKRNEDSNTIRTLQREQQEMRQLLTTINKMSQDLSVFTSAATRKLNFNIPAVDISVVNSSKNQSTDANPASDSHPAIRQINTPPATLPFNKSNNL